MIGADGTTIYVGQEVANNMDVWVLDTSRGTRTRLTFDPGRELGASPVPHSDRMIYQGGPATLASAGEWFVLSRSMGGGAADTLDRGYNPTVSPDGKWAVYSKIVSGSADLFAKPLEPAGPPILVAGETGIQAGGVVSPAGNLVAYFSTEAGEPEVFLRRFPAEMN